VAVVGPAERPNEGEVDRRRDATQQVIFRNEPVEGEVVIVELGVEFSLA
jgi:hypothetical protein